MNNDAYKWADGTAVDRLFSANNLNQYTQVAGGNLSYDVRGNLTQSGGVNYTYTSENLMASAGTVSLL